jgi:hypothetical protein
MSIFIEHQQQRTSIELFAMNSITDALDWQVRWVGLSVFWLFVAWFFGFSKYGFQPRLTTFICLGILIGGAIILYLFEAKREKQARELLALIRQGT